VKDDTKPPGFRIKRLRVYTMIDDKNEEGVVGFMAPDGTFYPLVSADERRDIDWAALAQNIANQNKTTVLVSEFLVRKNLPL